MTLHDAEVEFALQSSNLISFMEIMIREDGDLLVAIFIRSVMVIVFKEGRFEHRTKTNSRGRIFCTHWNAVPASSSK